MPKHQDKRRRLDDGGGVGPEQIYSNVQNPSDVDTSAGKGTVDPNSELEVSLTHEQFLFHRKEAFDTSFKNTTKEVIYPTTNSWKGANTADHRAAARNVQQGADTITFMYHNPTRWTAPDFEIVLEVRFLKPDGTAFPTNAEPNAADYFNVTYHNRANPRSNWVHSMFKNVTIQQGDGHELWGMNKNLYHWEAFLHNLLTTKEKQRRRKYKNEGFYTGVRDPTLGTFDPHAPPAAADANVIQAHKNLQDRFLGAGSPTKQYVIPCYHWLCKQKLAIPPATTLKIELERNLPHMFFNAAAEGNLPICELVDIRLQFRTTELEPTISDKLSMNVLTDPYYLKVHRRQILQVTLPRGTKVFLPQLISSELPNRMMLALLDQASLSSRGSVDKSWQKWEVKDIQRMKLMYATQAYPHDRGYEFKEGATAALKAENSKLVLSEMLQCLYDPNQDEYDYVYNSDTWPVFPLFFFDLTQDRNAKADNSYERTTASGDCTLEAEFAANVQAGADTFTIMKINDFNNIGQVSLPSDTFAPEFV